MNKRWECDICGLGLLYQPLNPLTDKILKKTDSSSRNSKSPAWAAQALTETFGGDLFSHRSMWLINPSGVLMPPGESVESIWGNFTNI
jgi:hypothetical protein